MRLSKYLRAALCGLLLGASLSPAKAGGWQFQQPAVLVLPQSSHRSNVFYVGQPVVFSLNGNGASTYQVRDYWGNIVDQGAASPTLTLNVTAPGWYKLYLHGDTSVPIFGDSVGTTTFVIFRDDPHFPALPSSSVPFGYSTDYAADTPMRGVLGTGPARHYADATKASNTISEKLQDLALDQQFYLSQPDPVRPRSLMMNFSSGARNASSLAGVKTLAAGLQNSATYWEGRNEPNGDTSGTNYAAEMKSFYQTIKSVNPKLKVLGPSVVTVGPPLLPWIEDFLKAGGGNYIDGFSFHAYNVTNGDLWLARKTLSGMQALLAKYGQDKKEVWQTEQGFGAALYGVYEPRHQGRWTMLQAMAFEQYGIPKEHNAYYYDKSHGFWDFPTWWENDDGGLNPGGALMRVWAEELYGAKYVQAYDFGSPGSKMFIGSLFQGPGKSVAAFMSAGGTDGKVALQVTGGTTLHLVSAFGVESDVPVVDGQVTLPIPEIPVYVEMAPGQTIQVVPINWGTNLALQPGVTASASDYTPHAYSPTDQNDISKLFNGQLDTFYYNFSVYSRPFEDYPKQFPAWVEMDLPVPTQINRVVIYCPVPWQSQGSLLDYELQYDNNGQWVTIDHTVEPTNTFQVASPNVACTVDTFYSDRCIFTHEFAPVTTGKIRVLVHDCTWGGGATQDVFKAGGQPGAHKITISEIEVYSPFYNGAQSDSIQGRIVDTKGQGVAGATVALSGSQTKTTTTAQGGAYSFSGLTEGSVYTVMPTKSNYTLAARSVTFSHLVGGAVGDQSCNFVASSIPSETGTGLRGDYYNTGYDWNSAFRASNYKTTRVDATINTGSNWTTMTRPAGIGSQRFAVRWTGQIEPKYSETYTFTANADDGVRLWVNDQLLIDDWNQANYSTAHKPGIIKLIAGQRVNIRFEYFQQGGYSICGLKWASPSQPSEIVPQNRLYPATSDVPPAVGLNSLAGIVPDPNTGAIPLSAVATDTDGSVTQVSFAVNGTAVGTSQTPPYIVQWQPPQSGTYRITATAQDDMGAMTVSDPMTLTLGAEVLVKGTIQIRQKHHPLKVIKKPAVKKPAIKKLPVRKPAAKKLPNKLHKKMHKKMH